MGVHHLITGLNGAGKTLYTVATKLLPLSKSTINCQGADIPRRLVVGGIPDLLIPHELMEIPELDPEIFVDEWASVIRERGQPAVRFVRRAIVNEKTGAMGYVACDEDAQGAEPIVWSALNWWAWCQPGDVLVIDEAQRLFRPMASGRKVPKFVARLETARHYGVEFIYLTQHPQLLHTNLRNLVGPHEDVRRVFGSSRVMVYLWDKCSNPDRIAKATGRMWRHDKKAFGLYKSSELHTKFAQRLPFAVWGLLGGLVLLGVMGWTLKGRLTDRFSSSAAASGPHAAASSPVGTVPAPEPPSAQPGVATAVAGSGRFPVYDAEPFKLGREPYAGRALQIEGGYSAGNFTYALFGVLVDGQRVATVTLAQLVRAGYEYTEIGPCAGLLRFGQVERVLACGKRQVVPDAQSSPAAPAAPAGPAPVATGGASA
ncbi:zona occludens toxin (predicted ATPase) [Paucibacter oligotrophus]|uniref:Zona occludens toxin (Predicted ATPase) n=1 Tax=Roseateles oligotrophus TaxID=1769250 RepID=A0A840L6A0_9BURK|nr:zonular occludens toxin domain-containing protein [Roseateles oligotrophus]MBB4842212.1 zona occludens toxin (predicted ATPase) [Roseateles oligotrophus]